MFRSDFNENNRIVRQENIVIDGDPYFVSTVDLGIDHSFGDSRPLYYETMVFPNDSWDECYCKRYETREEAAEGHEKLIQDIREGKYIIKDGWLEEATT